MSVTVGYPLARPETTGVGAMLTDGQELLEVVDVRVRRVEAGARELRIQERRLRSAAAELDAPGRWVPFSQVMALGVVRAADCAAL